MLPTYPAVLRSGQIEWGTDSPPALPLDTPIPVHVTLLGPPRNSQPSGAAMVAALTALAAIGGPSGFGNPDEWQRETRADRDLPGRVES